MGADFDDEEVKIPGATSGTAKISLQINPIPTTIGSKENIQPNNFNAFIEQ